MKPQNYWLEIHIFKYGSNENNVEGGFKMLAYSIVTFSKPFIVFDGNIGDNLSFFKDTQPITFFKKYNRKLKVVY